MANIPLKPIKKDYHRGIRRVIIVLLGLSAAYLLVVFVLFFIKSPGVHPSLSKIEEITALKFPASSTLIGSSGRRYLGIAIWAKVEMGREDVGAFIGSLPIVSHSADFDRISHMSPMDADWWDVELVRNAVYIRSERTVTGNVTKHFDIVIDYSRAYSAVVYLQYM